MNWILEKFNDFIIKREDKNLLWEMSNLTAQDTGLLGFVVFVNSGGEKSRHAARIKVVKGIKWKSGEDVSIQIEGVPRIIGKNSFLTQDDFNKIVMWVNLNRKVIMQYWNSEIDTRTMLNSIVPLK